MQEHESIVGDEDPERDGRGSDTRDAWRQVTEHLTLLGSTLRDHYAGTGQDRAVQELRTALDDLSRAAGQLSTATTQAMSDPAVADRVKATVSAVATAVAHTIQDIAVDAAGTAGTSGETGPATEANEQH